MALSLRTLLRSSRSIALKPLHLHKGCLWWIGHYLFGSATALSALVVSVDTLVLCIEIGVLPLLPVHISFFCAGEERTVVLKLGSLQALASLHVKSTKKENAGNATL